MTDAKMDALIGELAANTAAHEANTSALQALTAALQNGATARPAPSQGAGGQRATGGTGGASGAVFPPYGRSKGQPVRGATAGDLEYYLAGCKRSLADPGKARFHDKERVLRDAILSEIHRQIGGDNTPSGGQGPHEPQAPDFGGPPPPEGDDIPFIHARGIR